MRRIVAVLLAVACLVGMLASTAGAAITTPGTSPFVVPGDAAGTPQAFTVVGTGFTPNSNVFVEQCDGVAPTAPGWTPTEHCDLGSFAFARHLRRDWRRDVPRDRCQLRVHAVQGRESARAVQLPGSGTSLTGERSSGLHELSGARLEQQRREHG